MNTKNTSILILSVILIIVSLTLVYFTSFTQHRNNEAENNTLPTIAPVTNFNLIDQNNNEVSSSTLLGAPWVVNFIFTRCGGPCPIMSSKMYTIQEQVPDNIKLVSFTIDPEHDTPVVLKEYAKKYRARKGKWLFLTGDKNSIHNLSITTFKLGLKETPEEGTNNAFVHSTRFILIDSKGMIRGYYNSNDETALQKLIDDCELLTN